MGRHIKKAITLLILLCICCAVAAGCGINNGKKGTITIGVRDDIMNFSYLNKKAGKYYGLEIDLAKDMAERIGYDDVEFVTVQPDTRKEMLLDGKVDCVIATYSITDTRTENFDFSEPYYKDTTKIMVENSSLITKANDLKNKKIGILNGSNAGPLLAIKLNELGIIGDKVISNSDTMTEYQGATAIKSNSYKDLSDMLEVGSIDAMCLDSCIAGTYMDKDSRSFLDTIISEQEYGVATRKDSDLSKSVDKVIKEMLQDGTMEELIDKWD